ncbi:variant erythrocyte surface antigen-1 beta subunit [Babesia bovis T2Bo]|uniref:variant erythrocyte surface antigen-1 beta subunit n=1 Tax=Babesia bovis T2Bo TaxID=484906 RepID=UPI001C368B82|nr:variant erythrocyte surface antigen-1 beta subunit [Babesia bovis T2Bo]KAG6440213.1 variant erythrocyte surface antigen-1 beta subunit [Babesia bovis T2Bo]
MAAAKGWKPHDSLTQAPTNLKEAIDWVLRVTGRDGKKNEAAQPPPKPENAPHCLCYLAKAVKDLLYDARSPGSPGPHPERYWDGILLDQEQSIVKPVLTDLGLLSGGSTSAARDTCAGGTEVIGTLIDHLALGLQKWVGWQDQGKHSNATIRYCDGSGIGSQWTAGNVEQEYQSSYDNCASTPNDASIPPSECSWPTISDQPDQVHLLARIFLGSVCLIWSGLSQLGWLVGDNRWRQSSLYDISDTNAGLGSFMASMGYDLDKLYKGSGYLLWNIFAGKNDKPGAFEEFTKGADSGSVAEYYSSIYSTAKTAVEKKLKTEQICKQYPLLVLHILASGYFRAGSAGANKVTVTASPATEKKETPSPRKPRTIREILYWLSALPYSQGYRALVERMQQKTDQVTQGNSEDKKGQIELYDTSAAKASTTLKRDCITHYLMAACGYCPLVLIGIQGTIEREVTSVGVPGVGVPGVGVPGAVSPAAAAAEKNRCPEHKKDPKSKRCTLDDKDKAAEAATQAPAPPSASTGQQLKPGQVCYGGYHLAVKDFGPLHGMYANGLFGFDMDGSPAQCLDQLRAYVYHCFYQLYFLRKQCKEGVATDKTAVLGWKSCRYGFQVGKMDGKVSNKWICQTDGTGGLATAQDGKDHTKKCGVFEGTSNRTESPLQSFLCDRLGSLRCKAIIGKGNVEEYPEIKEHMDPEDISPLGHIGKPPIHCPVPMGWSMDKEKHFKDLSKTHKIAGLDKGSGVSPGNYPIHCTGNTLSLLLEYYCDPEKCQSGTLVVLLRLLACITPTVPRTLGDLFGFYYYIVYIGGNKGVGEGVYDKLKGKEKESKLHMPSIGGGPDAVVTALETYGGDCKTGTQNGSLKCLVDCAYGTGAKYLSPLSGQQYGQLSPVMAGTYLSWLVYLIGEFQGGLDKLKEDYMNIQCKDECGTGVGGAASGCGDQCRQGNHGDKNNCCGCSSIVSCTGVLPVLYKYGFGYGDVKELHDTGGTKKCHEFLGTLEKVLTGDHLKNGSTTGLHHEINQLIYTTRLPWIFVLTLAWLVAVLYLAFGAIWPLDWTHMRSHWLRGGEHQWQCMWYKVMTGRKGMALVEYFGKT